MKSGDSVNRITRVLIGLYWRVFMMVKKILKKKGV